MDTIAREREREREMVGEVGRNQTTVKSRQMVIRGHRGDDIQNVNRTNQSDLVGHKTDPRTFEDCTRGMCVAAATPGNFSAVEWTFDMLFCSWILVRELRFGDEQHCPVSFPAGFAYNPLLPFPSQWPEGAHGISC